MSESARYQVRTPMWLWLTNGLLTAFDVLVIGAIAIVGDVPGMVSAYRVGGGRNLIRFDDRLDRELAQLD